MNRHAGLVLGVQGAAHLEAVELAELWTLGTSPGATVR